MSNPENRPSASTITYGTDPGLHAATLNFDGFDITGPTKQHSIQITVSFMLLKFPSRRLARRSIVYRKLFFCDITNLSDLNEMPNGWIIFRGVQELDDEKVF
jgi:hypothetical protein